MLLVLDNQSIAVLFLSPIWCFIYGKKSPFVVCLNYQNKQIKGDF